MNSRPLTGTIDEEIRMHLETAEPDPVHIHEILARGRNCAVSVLPKWLFLQEFRTKPAEELFKCTTTIKNKIKQKNRSVLPLYVTNICKASALLRFQSW